MNKKFLIEWLEFNQVKRYAVTPFMGYITFSPNLVNVIYAGNFYNIDNDISSPMNEMLRANTGLTIAKNSVILPAYEPIQRYEVFHGYIITIPEYNLTGTISLFRQQSPFGENTLPPISTVSPYFEFAPGYSEIISSSVSNSAGIIRMNGYSRFAIHINGNPFDTFNYDFTGGFTQSGLLTGTPWNLTVNSVTGDVNFSFSHSLDSANEPISFTLIPN